MAACLCWCCVSPEGTTDGCLLFRSPVSLGAGATAARACSCRLCRATGPISAKTSGDGHLRLPLLLAWRRVLLPSSLAPSSFTLFYSLPPPRPPIFLSFFPPFPFFSCPPRHRPFSLPSLAFSGASLLRFHPPQPSSRPPRRLALSSHRLADHQAASPLPSSLADLGLLLRPSSLPPLLHSIAAANQPWQAVRNILRHPAKHAPSVHRPRAPATSTPSRLCGGRVPSLVRTPARPHLRCIASHRRPVPGFGFPSDSSAAASPRLARSHIDPRGPAEHRRRRYR